MSDFLPILATGLGIAGAGYLGLSFLMGDKSAPKPPVAVERVSVPETLSVVEDDIIVLDWVGDRFEASSTPRLDVTV